MGNSRGLIMLIVALIAAFAAVVFANKWLTSRAEKMQQVVVAAVDINMGEKLGPEMFKTIDWPAANVPENTFSEVQKLNGRVTKVSLQKGEAVLETKLAPEGSSGGLSAVIAEGKRAITVRVNDVVGVAGFALPGNFVDVIMNTDNEVGQGDNRKTKHISKTVLEHIMVLAVAQEANRDETAPKVVNAVTLEVTPEQAEVIDLARNVGTLSLVLRNQADASNADTQGITKELLLSLQEETQPPSPAPVTERVVVKEVKVAAKVVAQPKKQCTKVITGLTESMECF